MRNPHGQFYSIPAHLNNCGTQLISLSRDNLLSLWACVDLILVLRTLYVEAGTVLKHVAEYSHLERLQCWKYSHLERLQCWKYSHLEHLKCWKYSHLERLQCGDAPRVPAGEACLVAPCLAMPSCPRCPGCPEWWWRWKTSLSLRKYLTWSYLIFVTGATGIPV